MELRDLRYFCTAAETEHISKAAEKLGVERAANMVMLGAILKETGVVKPDTVYTELEHMFSGRKAKFLAPNRKALDLYL